MTKAPNHKTIERISDLQPDSLNANKGTERGSGMLERSLRTHGAGRSILADRDGVVIAGNKTLEHAAAIGLDIQTVHSDGTKLVVVVRDDLSMDDVAARELAIYDNRTSEASLSWDTEALTQLFDAGVDANEFWFPEELATLFAVEPTKPVESAGMPPRMVTCPSCGESFNPES